MKKCQGDPAVREVGSVKQIAVYPVASDLNRADAKLSEGESGGGVEDRMSETVP